MGHETTPSPPRCPMGQEPKWKYQMGYKPPPPPPPPGWNRDTGAYQRNIDTGAYQMGRPSPTPPPPSESHRIKCAYCGCIIEHTRCENCGACNEGQPKPRKLIGRLIREGTIGECPVCDSTLHRKYLFFKTDKCINPECTIKSSDHKPQIIPVIPNKIVTE